MQLKTNLDLEKLIMICVVIIKCTNRKKMNLSII